MANKPGAKKAAAAKKGPSSKSASKTKLPEPVAAEGGGVTAPVTEGSGKKKKVAPPVVEKPASKKAARKKPVEKAPVAVAVDEAATALPVEKAKPVKPVSKKSNSVKKKSSNSDKDAASPGAKADETTSVVKRSALARGPVAAKRRPLFAHLNPKPVIASSEDQKAKKPSAAFIKQQKQKLLDLRDSLVDQMSGVVRDSLGRGDDSADSSAFGMHQADAGSDSYDRDFALNILSQEQDALREIDEALQRIESGEYGICQGSGAIIPQARLEAMPFARCTVEYQERLDREQEVGNFRAPVTSLFGLEEKEVGASSDDEEED